MQRPHAYSTLLVWFGGLLCVCLFCTWGKPEHLHRAVPNAPKTPEPRVKTVRISPPVTAPFQGILSPFIPEGQRDVTLASVVVVDDKTLIDQTISAKDFMPVANAAQREQGSEIPVFYNLDVDSAAVLRRFMNDLYEAAPRFPNASAATLPTDLNRLEIENKKGVFVQTLLPLIAYYNKLSLSRRRRLEMLKRRGRRPLIRSERQFLQSMVRHYRLDATSERFATLTDTLDALLLRADAIPPSIVLAQAAMESGWGTSRFCRKANNLFGQRVVVWKTPGMAAGEHPDEWFQLAVFPTIGASVRSYMRNLNTHWAYESFRILRHRMHNRTEPHDLNLLAASLDSYSTRGQAYVEDLMQIIEQNRLTRFDNATFGAPLLADVFSDKIFDSTN